MTIRDDDGGLETLPLRLMIVAAVVALSIVPAADSLESFRSREFVQRAERQLDMIVSAAEIIAMQGPGNVRTLSVDLRGGGAAGFSMLFLGDKNDGPNMSSAIIELRNGMRLIKSAASPAVWMRSPTFDALIVSSEMFDIRMSAVLDGGTLSVVAEEV
ncbi:MAG TPA: hypothetical protein VGB78_06275 [Thermoplasmata archaeon]|jgi:hypothetical protein